ncbi:MAG: glycosyltransferase family 2 protein [Candidatus Woesearchaeota archaeon]
MVKIMKSPKVTIITVCFNSRRTIEKTIKSVLSQNYKNIEYIVIDGASKDNTLKIVNKYKSRISKVVSEPDKGIYDAMNKGLKYARGDIVGFLNSDDVYKDDKVISRIVKEVKDKQVDAVYGDVVYVDNEGKIVRHYKSFKNAMKGFRKGYCPAHPTFFARKELYDKYGGFVIRYRFAADFELMLRLLGGKNVKYSLIPDVLVKMRTGGQATASLKNIFRSNKEVHRISKKYGLGVGWFKIMVKLGRKWIHMKTQKAKRV